LLFYNTYNKIQLKVPFMFTITEDKIIEAAEQLKAAGKNPTQVTVREALGGGSFATIGPALKAWKDAQKEDHALAEVQVPEAITERLEQLQGAVWQAAVDEAERRLTAEREALKVAQEAAAAEVTEQQESVAALEAEADKTSEAMKTLASESEARRNQIENLKDELQALKAESDTDRQTYASTLTKLEGSFQAAVERAERAEALHEKAQIQAREDRDAVAKQARADLNEQKKAHDEAISELNQAIKEAREASAAAVKKAEESEQAAQAKAVTAEKEAQRQGAGEQACQSRLEAAQREIEQAQTRLIKLEEKADRAIQEAAELRGELKALRSMNNSKKSG
jgi:chromosome segregation ATPase